MEPAAVSVAFSAAGDKAYVVLNGRFDEFSALPDQLAVLDITGPGRVSLNAASAVTLPRTTWGGFFGVDVIAVAGDKAYVGYPTESWIEETNPLVVVDLTDYSAIPLDVGGFCLCAESRDGDMYEFVCAASTRDLRRLDPLDRWEARLG